MHIGDFGFLECWRVDATNKITWGMNLLLINYRKCTPLLLKSYANFYDYE